MEVYYFINRLSTNIGNTTQVLCDAEHIKINLQVSRQTQFLCDALTLAVMQITIKNPNSLFQCSEWTGSSWDYSAWAALPIQPFHQSNHLEASCQRKSINLQEQNIQKEKWGNIQISQILGFEAVHQILSKKNFQKIDLNEATKQGFTYKLQ